MAQPSKKPVGIVAPFLINNQEMQPSTQTPPPEGPHVVITEQPQYKLRFSYDCSSSEIISGIDSTSEQKSFPSIEIRGYKGRAVVVVSCVTKDAPHRPHPHNLVGREGCKKGICTVEINSSSMSHTFKNLGVQSTATDNDIVKSLQLRKEIRVDPFKTGFDHSQKPYIIDLDAIRLCFQVFLEGRTKGRFSKALEPVVSDVIHNRKVESHEGSSENKMPKQINS